MCKKKYRERHPSIRFLVMSILGAVLTVFMVIFAYIFVTNMLKMLNQSEDEQILAKSGIVTSAFDTSMIAVRAFSTDWASWDETYEFAVGNNPDHFSRYWTQDWKIQGQQYNFLYVKDLSGGDLYSKYYDYFIEENVPPPEGFSEFLSDLGEYMLQSFWEQRAEGTKRPTGKDGVIFYSGVPYYICARPILTYDEKSDPAGSLFFGRIISAQELERITGTHDLYFTVTDDTRNGVPKGVPEEVSDNGGFIQRTKDRISFSMPIKGFYDNQSVTLKIESSRDLYKKGLNVIVSSCLVLGMVMIIFVFVIFWLLQKYVLSHIERVSSDIKEVVESSQSIDAGKYGGSKEFYTLAASINEMLVTLDESKKNIIRSTVSRQTLESILNGLNIYLLVNDLDTCRILFMNDKMKEHFQIKDDVIGKYSYDVLSHCSDSKEGFCPKKLLLNNPRATYACEIQHKFNQRYYKQFDLLIDWVGVKNAHLLYLIDITENKQAETALRRMESFINSAPQTIMSYIKPGGEFDFFNPLTCEISGYAPEELMAGGVYMLYDEETEKYLHDVVIPEIFLKGEYEFEVPVICKNGEKRIINFLGFQIEKDTYDRGYIGTDVTERRKLEKELIEAKEAAEQASRAKSDFLSRMSHEIRTPMNAIIGMTNIARASDSSKKKEYCLGKIEDASKHLLGVINDILDMSKIEADKFELSYGKFNIRDMIKNIVNMLNFRVDNKQLVFTINMDGDIPLSVIGDETRLSQVIMNLLSNAVKFTPENGMIILSVKKIEEDEIMYTFQIEVEDNGIGISAEQQARLFTSFEQADNGIARKFGGTGLGLAISRRIVELMGGEIWIESELGKGAKFIFTVKVDKSSMDSKRISQDSMGISAASGEREDFNVNRLPPAKDSLKDYTLLLAEDVDINREIIFSILEDSGITIDFAENGLEAFMMFSKQPDKYSLILMDIQMPKMDGYEATRKMRSLDIKRAKEIPIIAMTANVFKEDIEFCLEAGMDDHIGKPIDVNCLYEKINKYLLPAIPYGIEESGAH